MSAFLLIKDFLENTMNDQLQIFLTLIPIFIGLSLIFYAWKEKKDKSKSLSIRARSLVLLGGWVSIFISLMGWIQIKGIEFGLAWWCLCVALLSFFLVSTNATGTKNSIDKRVYKNRLISLKRTGRGFLTFLYAGPIALAASCLLSIISSELLPIQKANSLVLAAFLFPVTWAILSYWICSTDKRLIPVGTTVLSGTLSGLLIFY